MAVFTVNGTGGNDSISTTASGYWIVSQPGISSGTLKSQGAGTTFIINGLAGNDTIATGTQADTIYGGDGDDVVRANGGNDLVYGEAGADALSGQAGNDTLVGGDGNDSLIGGADFDRLVGGAGADEFTFAKADGGFNFVTGQGTGTDQIIDFQAGVDHLYLTGFASATRFAYVRDSIYSTSSKYLIVGEFASTAAKAAGDYTGATYSYALTVGIASGTLNANTDVVWG